jgi:tRNASer (uridine44-2'-O)-methyltransferase
LKDIFYLNGFDVYKDKLRIPSTKNICLIGIRNPEKDIDHEKLILLTDKDSSSFKIRDFEEEKQKSSRNCTRNIDNDIKEYIVKKILNCLLSGGEKKFIVKNNNENWQVGRKVNISEIIKLFDSNQLTKLKQECGGIKTMIKNYHQLFEIVEKDYIKLRIEQVDNKKNKDMLKFIKTKQCLFDLYHPNGCLLESIQCCFIHSQ